MCWAQASTFNELQKKTRRSHIIHADLFAICLTISKLMVGILSTFFQPNSGLSDKRISFCLLGQAKSINCVWLICGFLLDFIKFGVTLCGFLGNFPISFQYILLMFWHQQEPSWSVYTSTFHWHVDNLYCHFSFLTCHHHHSIDLQHYSLQGIHQCLQSAVVWAMATSQ